MKHVAILDTNALFGLKSLTRGDFTRVTALARMGYIRLVVPDVVVQELARQAAKELSDKWSTLRNAVDGFNGVASEAAAIGVAVTPSPARLDPLQPADRSTVHAALTTFLKDRQVETPTYPDVTVSDLLARDLDSKKPFAASGKGFRDALIWETVRELCDGLGGSDTLVVFVTGNHTDFCIGKGKGLHSHLRDDLRPGQRFEVVENLPALLAHEEVATFVESLRVVNEALTPKKVAKLVDDALSELWGLELASTVGVYDGDGFYEIPIDTSLDDTAFNEIYPDSGTIAFEVFRTGNADEMTIRVTVDADVDIEGFIDKGELLAADDDNYSNIEDWNRHVFRASESHHVRFTLSADFDGATVGGVALHVDEIEEVSPAARNPRARAHWRG